MLFWKIKCQAAWRISKYAYQYCKYVKNHITFLLGITQGLLLFLFFLLIFPKLNCKELEVLEQTKAIRYFKAIETIAHTIS